ncbi:hypothetical protein GCM10028825_13900 [Spirosoma agri]
MGDGGPAPSSFVNHPTGVAVDQNGVVYIADTDNNRIRKVTVNGSISTVAGNGLAGFRGDGGPAVDAQLDSPYGIAVDKDGNLYIADKDNNAVRKVTPTGSITTLVGCCGSGSDGGPATKASVFQPSGVAVDMTGNIYIAETGYHRIRKISTDGIISTVAGTGAFGFSGDGGPATSAKLYEPYGVSVDTEGNLYIADRSNHRIRKVSTTGVISTVAGTGANSYSGDGGPATKAALALPSSVAVDKSGNLFIADSRNMLIRKVNTSGIINRVAGNGSTGFGGDGGPATSARLYYPVGVAVQDDGTFYIADATNTRVRKVTPAGTISTLAGNGKTFSGDGGPATKADLYVPSGVATDGQGNLFIADQLNHQVRRVSPTGIISTIAGTGTFGYSGDGGTATSAMLNSPTSVAVDRIGNVFIADTYNRRIRKVSSDGTISTVAGDGYYDYKGDGGPATSASMKEPTGVTVDDTGNLYIVDRESATIRKVSTTGIITRISTSVALIAPQGIAVDKNGNLFIADAGNYVVRKVTTTGVTTTVAGNGIGQSTGDGGPATSAGLNYPTGVAVATDGTLFIADQGGNRVRKVTPAGSITTVAGNGVYNFSGDGELGTRASIAKPTGIAVDGSGNLFIADRDNNRIRRVASPIISSVQNGDWSSSTTWSCTCVPKNTDEVSILSGHAVTISQVVQIRVVRQYGTLIFTPTGKLLF